MDLKIKLGMMRAANRNFPRSEQVGTECLVVWHVSLEKLVNHDTQSGNHLWRKASWASTLDRRGLHTLKQVHVGDTPNDRT
jgi:hypothetical protein